MRSSLDARQEAALQAFFAELEAQPWAHDFFHVIRRIESLRPDLPRWGSGARPSQEAIRLGQVPEMDFAPAALARFDRKQRVPRLGVRFLGLLGPQGPMPLHMTEYVRERLHNHADPTLARFLDVFHHRMLSLFYRGWAQAQPTVQRDRPHDDRYAAWLGATFGLTNTLATRDAIPVPAKLYQAGLIAARSRHPEALCKVLRQYFGVPANLVEHVPHWMSMAPAERSRLGHARNRIERVSQPPARLGHSANAGARVWDRQYKFRLVLGPMSLARYMAFIPGGSAWPVLRDWVRLLAGSDMQWELELMLHHRQVPEPRLGRGPRMGLSSWLGHGGRVAGALRAAPDRHDLRIRPHSSLALRHPGEPHG